jgi:hypothetical protein
MCRLPQGDTPADRAYRRRLTDRLTELRLAVDLGDIEGPAAFRTALERDGIFAIDDPRVEGASVSAGLGPWLIQEAVTAQTRRAAGIEHEPLPAPDTSGGAPVIPMFMSTGRATPETRRTAPPPR